MPVKWKIFLALNFIVLVPALVALILLLINLFNAIEGRRSDGEMISVALVIFVVLTFNASLNIYLIQRFYPDKHLSVGVKRLSILSLVLIIFVSAVILVLCIYAASQEFSADYKYRDTRGKIALAVLFFIWLIQTIIIVVQAQLPGLISRNHREKMVLLIDSIGQ